jgi:uncharacterized protein (TIGR01777 family)
VKYLLAGASGFLGTALRVRLAEAGHEVVRLVRREPATGTEFNWDPDAGTLDRAAFAGVDVVVSLSGAGVADRPWTPSRRQLILDSRTRPNGTLARALADLPEDARPGTLISASGISIYGTTSSSIPHTEASPPGTDYLAGVVVAWEGAARPAAEAGLRVVHLRTSPVLDSSGGAFKLMRLAWSTGLGARLGDGRQRMPMIALEDYLRALVWAAENPAASGAYNLTIPEPATNREFSDALAAALHRPRVLAAPAFVLRRALGQLAEQLLGDMFVVPERLTAQGFQFDAPGVRATVASALHRDR